MKHITVVVLVLSLAGCASMPTKEKRAREAAELGLVSHPELAEVMAAIARLEAKYDTLLAKMNTVEEAHRDDTELVIDYVRRELAALKADLNRRQP